MSTDNVITEAAQKFAGDCRAEVNGAAAANLEKVRAQKIALACLIKPKELTAAKQMLRDGYLETVEFTAHVKAVVSKGSSSPGASGTRPASVELFTRGVVSEVFRRLKISPARLRQVLQWVAKRGWGLEYAAESDNSELLKVFDEVGASIAAELPEIPWTSPGRAGDVKVEGTVTFA